MIGSQNTVPVFQSARQLIFPTKPHLPPLDCVRTRAHF
jgi:hypothetical protein